MNSTACPVNGFYGPGDHQTTLSFLECDTLKEQHRAGQKLQNTGQHMKLSTFQSHPSPHTYTPMRPVSTLKPTEVEQIYEEIRPQHKFFEELELEIQKLRARQEGNVYSVPSKPRRVESDTQPILQVNVEYSVPSKDRRAEYASENYDVLPPPVQVKQPDVVYSVPAKPRCLSDTEADQRSSTRSTRAASTGTVASLAHMFDRQCSTQSTSPPQPPKATTPPSVYFPSHYRTACKDGVVSFTGLPITSTAALNSAENHDFASGTQNGPRSATIRRNRPLVKSQSTKTDLSADIEDQVGTAHIRYPPRPQRAKLCTMTGALNRRLRQLKQDRLQVAAARHKKSPYQQWSLPASDNGGCCGLSVDLLKEDSLLKNMSQKIEKLVDSIDRQTKQIDTIQRVFGAQKRTSPVPPDSTFQSYDILRRCSGDHNGWTEDFVMLEQPKEELQSETSHEKRWKKTIFSCIR